MIMVNPYVPIKIITYPEKRSKLIKKVEKTNKTEDGKKRKKEWFA